MWASCAVPAGRRVWWSHFCNLQHSGPGAPECPTHRDDTEPQKIGLGQAQGPGSARILRVWVLFRFGFRASRGFQGTLCGGHCPKLARGPGFNSADPHHMPGPVPFGCTRDLLLNLPGHPWEIGRLHSPLQQRRKRS